MSNSCSPLCRAKAGTRARRPAKATAGFASVLQLARLGVPTQLRELRIQTRPTRLSGSLEGLPCCSPAIQTSSPSLQPRRILGRARVQTLRQAKSDRPLHANNKCHQLYATSEGGTSSYTKRRPHWTAAKRACTTRRRRSTPKRTAEGARDAAHR